MSSGLIRFFVAGVFALAAVVPYTSVAQQAPATQGRLRQVLRCLLPRPRQPSRPRRRVLRPPLRAPRNPRNRRSPARVRLAKPSIFRCAHLPISRAKRTRTKSTARFSVRSAWSSAIWIRPILRPRVVRSRSLSNSDDTGFKYHAGYPLSAAPEGKSSLSDSSEARTNAERQSDALRASGRIRRY